METEYVVLVDDQDEETGVMEKMDAHRSGMLHRAISVFIFNKAGDMLLQQRATGKYHSAGLWSNTCCSHPRQGEKNIMAAHRRLLEEMGMICQLHHLFSFTYKAELEHGLTEHELDHVYIGYTDNVPVPNPSEVAAYRYADMATLSAELKEAPQQFTEWFKIVFDRIKTEMPVAAE